MRILLSLIESATGRRRLRSSGVSATNFVAGLSKPTSRRTRPRAPRSISPARITISVIGLEIGGLHERSNRYGSLGARTEYTLGACMRRARAQRHGSIVARPRSNTANATRDEAPVRRTKDGDGAHRSTCPDEKKIGGEGGQNVRKNAMTKTGGASLAHCCQQFRPGVESSKMGLIAAGDKAKADLFYPAKFDCLRHSRGCKSAIRQFANYVHFEPDLSAWDVSLAWRNSASEKKPPLTAMSMSSCLVICPASLSASIKRSASATRRERRDGLCHFGNIPILKLDEFSDDRDGRLQLAYSSISLILELPDRPFKWSYARLICWSIERCTLL